MRIRESVSAKVIFLLLTGVIIFMTGMGGVWYHYEKTDELRLIESETKSVADRLSNSLATPVWTLDDEEIRKVILLEMSKPDIVAIVLRANIGDFGIIIGKVRLPGSDMTDYSWSDKALNDKLDKSFLTQYRQIMLKGIWIGAVAVYVTDTYVMRRLDEMVMRVFLQIAMIAMLVAIILFLSLRKIVLAPLITLEQGTNRLREQDFGVILWAESDDEIGRVTRAFNEMADQIRKNFEQIRESERKFSGLLARLNEAVFRMSVPDGKYEYCSPAAEKVFGYDARAFANNPFLIRQIIHPDFAEYFDEEWKKVLAGQVSPEYEYEITDPDGQERWIFQTNSRVCDIFGNIVALESCCTDITARKKAEAANKELEEQLERSKKMESLGLLAGGVAHDLNNVLAGIVGYPDLLLANLPSDSPMRKPLSNIRDSGLKAAAIVQDLLALARRGVMTTQVVNLNDIVAEYLGSPEHESLMRQHPDVEIRTCLAPDLLNISGSPVHLKKTVMNLVYNAAEAQPEGGSIVISTRNEHIGHPVRGYEHIRKGEFAVLTVEDRGVGIASDDLKRIFEPFYSKKVMGRSGTGLGMAVVWGTVRDHDGYTDVRSTEGSGTVFDLFFPITGDRIAPIRESIPTEAYGGKGETILVADDESQQRELASNMLRFLGYDVHTVSCGEEAIAWLKDHTPDLIVLDMIMETGMDGLDTYRKIVETYPERKTIIASGYAETDRVKEARRLGAGQYVRKPYTLENIGMAVRTELDK